MAPNFASARALAQAVRGHPFNAALTYDLRQMALRMADVQRLQPVSQAIQNQLNVLTGPYSPNKFRQVTGAIADVIEPLSDAEIQRLPEGQSWFSAGGLHMDPQQAVQKARTTLGVSMSPIEDAGSLRSDFQPIDWKRRGDDLAQRFGNPPPQPERPVMTTAERRIEEMKALVDGLPEAVRIPFYQRKLAESSLEPEYDAWLRDQCALAEGDQRFKWASKRFWEGKCDERTRDYLTEAITAYQRLSSAHPRSQQIQKARLMLEAVECRFKAGESWKRGDYTQSVETLLRRRDLAAQIHDYGNYGPYLDKDLSLWAAIVHRRREEGVTSEEARRIWEAFVSLMPSGLPHPSILERFSKLTLAFSDWFEALDDNEMAVNVISHFFDVPQSYGTLGEELEREIVAVIDRKIRLTIPSDADPETIARAITPDFFKHLYMCSDSQRLAWIERIMAAYPQLRVTTLIQARFLLALTELTLQQALAKDYLSLGPGGREPKADALYRWASDCVEQASSGLSDAEREEQADYRRRIPPKYEAVLPRTQSMFSSLLSFFRLS